MVTAAVLSQRPTVVCEPAVSTESVCSGATSPAVISYSPLVSAVPSYTFVSSPIFKERGRLVTSSVPNRQERS